jgi:hypothetical protein
MRWVNITFRTAHLVGVAGIGGAFLYNAPPEAWAPYFWLTIVSGFVLLILEVWSNSFWVFQLRGIATVAKLLVLLSALRVGAEPYIIVAVIIISGVISHAPGKVRYFAILKRPVSDE